MPASPAYRVAVALLLIAGVPGALASLAGGGSVPGLDATHPRSVLPYGASSFYSDLSRYWDAAEGGVDLALGADAVLVIAPDRPFEPREVELLRERASRGGYGVLIADETRAGALLARELLGVEMGGGYLLNPDVPPGSEAVYAVPVECRLAGRVFQVYFVKASYIESYPEWMEPICIAPEALTPEGRAEGVVVAVYGERGGLRALVAADSSVFANFLYDGLPGYPATRPLALAMVEAVAPRESRVVFETSHLAESDAAVLARLALFALSLPARALGAAEAPGAAALAALAAAGAATLALRPQGRPRGPGAGRPLAVYLARECLRVQGRGCPDWLSEEPGLAEAEGLALRLWRALSTPSAGPRRRRGA